MVCCVHANQCLPLFYDVSSNISNWNATNINDFMSQSTVCVFIITILVLSVGAVISNAIVLFVSKFATGGKSTNLIFIRSLCVGDAFMGLYGISKILLWLHIDKSYINCFLPDSLWITASTAFVLSLCWMNLDCCLKLSRPLDYVGCMEKKMVIGVMVFMWNVSFILGFIPLTGWNHMKYACAFFVYYNSAFLFTMSSLWVIGITMTICMQIFLSYQVNHIICRENFLSPQSREFIAYKRFIITIRIDLILWIFSNGPFVFFIWLSCDVCLLKDRLDVNYMVICMIPGILLKSIISAVVHGCRTTQIHDTVEVVSRKVKRSIRRPLTSRGISTVENNISRRRSTSDKKKRSSNNNGVQRFSKTSNDNIDNSLTVSVVSSTDQSENTSVTFLENGNDINHIEITPL